MDTFESYEAKKYVVIKEHYKDANGIEGAGLLLGDFDTYEEAVEFIKEQNEPDLVIFGPKEAIK